MTSKAPLHPAIQATVGSEKLESEAPSFVLSTKWRVGRSYTTRDEVREFLDNFAKRDPVRRATIVLLADIPMKSLPILSVHTEITEYPSPGAPWHLGVGYSHILFLMNADSKPATVREAIERLDPAKARSVAVVMLDGDEAISAATLVPVSSAAQTKKVIPRKSPYTGTSLQAEITVQMAVSNVRKAVESLVEQARLAGQKESATTGLAIPEPSAIPEARHASSRSKDIDDDDAHVLSNILSAVAKSLDETKKIAERIQLHSEIAGFGDGSTSFELVDELPPMDDELLDDGLIDDELDDDDELLVDDDMKIETHDG